MAKPPGLKETNADSLPHRRPLRQRHHLQLPSDDMKNQCGGIGMKTGGVPDIFARALMSASLAPCGFR